MEESDSTETTVQRLHWRMLGHQGGSHCAGHNWKEVAAEGRGWGDTRNPGGEDYERYQEVLRISEHVLPF